jgi:hypothetical protein
MVRGTFEQAQQKPPVLEGCPKGHHPGLHAFLKKLNVPTKMMRIKRLFKGSRRFMEQT